VSVSIGEAVAPSNVEADALREKVLALKKEYSPDID
jgi:hypothetical protein